MKYLPYDSKSAGKEGKGVVSLLLSPLDVGGTHSPFLLVRRSSEKNMGSPRENIQCTLMRKIGRERKR